MFVLGGVLLLEFLMKFIPVLVVSSFVSCAFASDVEIDIQKGLVLLNCDQHLEASEVQEALTCLKEAADKNHAGAQICLYSVYSRGWHVPHNAPEESKFLREVDKQSDREKRERELQEVITYCRQFEDRAWAQVLLGLTFYCGLGVKINNEEAISWFRRAADQQDRIGQYFVGLMYWRGHGVKQNYTEAMRWAILSASQKYPKAQNHMGVMYSHGSGVEQNAEEALKWFKLAAAQGEGFSYSWLGDYSVRSGHYEEALEHYQNALKFGHSGDQQNVDFLQETYKSYVLKVLGEVGVKKKIRSSGAYLLGELFKSLAEACGNNILRVRGDVIRMEQTRSNEERSISLDPLFQRYVVEALVSLYSYDAEQLKGWMKELYG